MSNVNFAQRDADIGILGGGAYYMGDINHSKHFYSPSLAAGGFYRYSFNPRNSLRFNANYLSLRGNDLDFSNDYQQARAGNFGTTLIDFALTTEFNFMTYKTSSTRKARYSPYVTGGLGYSFVLSSDAGAKNSTSLVFGAGFKYNISRRIGTGIEWSFRKTFTDSVDGIENIGAENNVFFHNKDWYSLVGLFVSYKIFNWRDDCPTYD